jgi:hypothetical protein
MSYLSVFEWLQETPISVGIRESTLLFPVLEGTHVLALALSVGTIVALDLRLVGWGMRKTPVSTIFEQLRPWSLLGFGLMFLTGILLFWSEPVKCATTGSFIVKMVLMAFAGVNALFFDRTVYPTVASWDTAVLVPSRAKMAGAVSLFLWFGVIFCGRWTAYF